MNSPLLLLLLWLLSMPTTQSQELHISFQEELVLDIQPCVPGIDCPCPANTEPSMLSYDNYVCLGTQKRSIEEEPGTKMNYTLDGMQTVNAQAASNNQQIDISVLIHLGLYDDTREHNFGGLDKVFLEHDFDFTFQEYFLLDVLADETDSVECPQGFHALMHPELPGAVLQLVACPFRLAYAYLQAMHPHFLVLPPSQSIPIGLYFSVENREGYQNFLLDQEYMVLLPCFPGSYCKGSDFFSLPTQCPKGMYAPAYGQAYCSMCPFNATTSYTGSRRMEQCLLSSSLTIEKLLLFSGSYPFQGSPPPQSYTELFAEQKRLKDTILEWLLSSLSLLLLQNKNGSNDLEVHILNWETD